MTQSRTISKILFGRLHTLHQVRRPISVGQPLEVAPAAFLPGLGYGRYRLADRQFLILRNGQSTHSSLIDPERPFVEQLESDLNSVDHPLGQIARAELSGLPAGA